MLANEKIAQMQKEKDDLKIQHEKLKDEHSNNLINLEDAKSKVNQLHEHNYNLQDDINTFNRLAFGRIVNKSKSKEKIKTNRGISNNNSGNNSSKIIRNIKKVDNSRKLEEEKNM